MSYQSVTSALTPDLFYLLDESSGTTATNLGATGSTDDATYAGGFTLGATSLISGVARSTSLNGAGSGTGIYDAATSAGASGGDTGTIICWAKFSAFNDLYLVDPGANGAMAVQVLADGKVYFVKRGTAVLASSASALSTGTTYFIACTKSGATIKVYVDAVDVTTGATDATCTAWSRLGIGCDIGSGSPASAQNGTFGGAAVWLTTALSAGDIASLYAAGGSVSPSITVPAPATAAGSVPVPTLSIARDPGWVDITITA